MSQEEIADIEKEFNKCATKKIINLYEYNSNYKKDLLQGKKGLHEFGDRYLAAMYERLGECEATALSEIISLEFKEKRKEVFPDGSDLSSSDFTTDRTIQSQCVASDYHLGKDNIYIDKYFYTRNDAHYRGDESYFLEQIKNCEKAFEDRIFSEQIAIGLSKFNSENESGVSIDLHDEDLQTYLKENINACKKTKPIDGCIQKAAKDALYLEFLEKEILEDSDFKDAINYRFSIYKKVKEIVFNDRNLKKCVYTAKNSKDYAGCKEMGLGLVKKLPIVKKQNTPKRRGTFSSKQNELAVRHKEAVEELKADFEELVITLSRDVNVFHYHNNKRLPKVREEYAEKRDELDSNKRRYEQKLKQLDKREADALTLRGESIRTFGYARGRGNYALMDASELAKKASAGQAWGGRGLYAAMDPYSTSYGYGDDMVMIEFDKGSKILYLNRSEAGSSFIPFSYGTVIALEKAGCPVSDLIHETSPLSQEERSRYKMDSGIDDSTKSYNAANYTEGGKNPNGQKSFKTYYFYASKQMFEAHDRCMDIFRDVVENMDIQAFSYGYSAELPSYCSDEGKNDSQVAFVMLDKDYWGNVSSYNQAGYESIKEDIENGRRVSKKDRMVYELVNNRGRDISQEGIDFWKDRIFRCNDDFREDFDFKGDFK